MPRSHTAESSIPSNTRSARSPDANRSHGSGSRTTSTGTLVRSMIVDAAVPSRSCALDVERAAITISSLPSASASSTSASSGAPTISSVRTAGPPAGARRACSSSTTRASASARSRAAAPPSSGSTMWASTTSRCRYSFASARATSSAPALAAERSVPQMSDMATWLEVGEPADQREQPVAELVVEPGEPDPHPRVQVVGRARPEGVDPDDLALDLDRTGVIRGEAQVQLGARRLGARGADEDPGDTDVRDVREEVVVL